MPGFQLWPNFLPAMLMVTYAVSADSNSNPFSVRAFQISRNGGRSWGHRYDPHPRPSTIHFRTSGRWISTGHPGPPLPTRSGGKTQPSHELHSFRARGGSRVVVEPGGVRVADWPWPVGTFPSQIPRTNWIAPTEVLRRCSSDGRSSPGQRVHEDRREPGASKG